LVSGAGTEFENLVDLSGSRFEGGVDLSNARFDRSFLFSDATAASRRLLSFQRSQFSESAIFRRTMFQEPVSFEEAAFDNATDFEEATFSRWVSFVASEFRADVDFSGARLLGLALFSNARFSREADFISSMFGPFGAPHRGRAFPCANGASVWTTFCRSNFDAGASFLGARFQGVTFALARADGDLNFQAAQFAGDQRCSIDHADLLTTPADFSTTRFLGEATFRGAQFDCLANFDQAYVHVLDLKGADLQELWLGLPAQSEHPNPGNLGWIGVLHLAVEDVDHIRIQDATSSEIRLAREHALELVEAAARAANDLGTANDARVRRLSLIRDSKPLVPRLFDWVVWWGLLGYLVQPVHQAIAIALAFLVAVVMRASISAPARSGSVGNPANDATAYGAGGAGSKHQATRRITFHTRAISHRLSHVWHSIEETLGVVFRLRPPEGGARLEYFLFKFLIVVLIVNVGNVWPPFRELLEGVF
jgi:uncharacterized protein YjbI with pentapeptide repeats